jgi:hypothetical protein
MPNINLNLGGLFGALAGFGAAAAIVVLAGGEARVIARIGIFGLIGGALAGNFLWAYFFPAARPPDTGPAK